MLPEVWASPEPTIARIDASRVRNQLVETGHAFREDDLDRLAWLGVSATRYPVLWEAVAPETPGVYDWSWTDRRLQGLWQRSIEPVVTLLHHGSGPRYTSLVDPDFPERFADFAEAAARRYPWVRRWTPINEPLTTARFSTLYGVWYPNGGMDHPAFGRAIVNEVRGIADAMRRIRRIVPDAEMILTEDLQSITALDPGVEAYAEYKRERRWLSCELLMGRVVRGHSLYAYLTETCEIPDGELAELAADPVPPTIVGFNYYPYSERIVASNTHGGPAHNYARFEIDPDGLSLSKLLREAYARLGIPLALTEVHVIGSERQRARWLVQRWEDALSVTSEGVPVVAFGAWAAFGMVDWPSLLRREENVREDGLFTCTPDGVPQATLAAHTLRALASGLMPGPLPPEPGWWERERAADVA